MNFQRHEQSAKTENIKLVYWAMIQRADALGQAVVTCSKCLDEQMFRIKHLLI